MNLNSFVLPLAIGGALIAIAIILFTIYNERHKYVVNSSQKLKAIEKLNGQFPFNPLDAEKCVQNFSNNRTQFEHDNYDKIFLKDVQSTPRVYTQMLESVHKNRSMYELYIKAFNDTMNAASKEETEIYRKHGYYQSLEESMCREIEQHPVTELVVCVRKYYTTPKGRNHYCRERRYFENDVIWCLNTARKEEEKKQTASYERSRMSNSLRYDVMKRDGFRCTICGASQLDGAKLEVDHIKPVSKGGKTEMYNLRTLCDRCNSGKRAKYDPYGDN